MATQPQADSDADSTIYDLGYQRYEGARIGRKQAVRSIYIESLRAAFGLGRSARAKIAPWALVFLALIPAIAQLAIGILFPGDEDIEVFKHEDYFNIVQFILALFVAIVGPDLAGRDRRNKTLSLYFSRAIARSDYALARLAGMVTAMLMLTLFPQTILYVGNALSVSDFMGYMRDEADLILPIIVTSIVSSLFLSAIGLLIAAHVLSRTFATVSIVLAFLAMIIIAGIITEIDAGLDFIVFLSPLDTMSGVGSYLFDSPPDSDSVAAVDFDGYIYLLAATGFIVATTGLLIRRYESLDA